MEVFSCKCEVDGESTFNNCGIVIFARGVLVKFLKKLMNGFCVFVISASIVLVIQRTTLPGRSEMDAVNQMKNIALAAHGLALSRGGILHQ